MKYYRLLTKNGYPSISFELYSIYSEEYSPNDRTVAEIYIRYPKDWEEITDKDLLLNLHIENLKNTLINKNISILTSNNEERVIIKKLCLFLDISYFTPSCNIEIEGTYNILYSRWTNNTFSYSISPGDKKIISFKEIIEDFNIFTNEIL